METAWSLATPVSWGEIDRKIVHRDSIENKVLEYFERNSDEELSIRDAAVKFGSLRPYMSRLLKSMHQRGLISRSIEDGVMVYRSGLLA